MYICTYVPLYCANNISWRLCMLLCGHLVPVGTSALQEHFWSPLDIRCQPWKVGCGENSVLHRIWFACWTAVSCKWPASMEKPKGWQNQWPKEARKEDSSRSWDSSRVGRNLATYLGFAALTLRSAYEIQEGFVPHRDPNRKDIQNEEMVRADEPTTIRCKRWTGPVAFFLFSDRAALSTSGSVGKSSGWTSNRGGRWMDCRVKHEARKSAGEIKSPASMEAKWACQANASSSGAVTKEPSGSCMACWNPAWRRRGFLPMAPSCCKVFQRSS